jgi:SAM-dependent methyltransferase
MREKLLEVLAEPVTGAKLSLDVTKHEGAHILEGSLRSEQTGKSYPIVRGIPRFVSSDNYAHSFGTQWNKFRAVQIDSETLISHSRARFDDETGWPQDSLEGKWVLDAGCGAGRFAEIAAERGAELVALDYSSAVDAARATLARFPNADVVQGSILEPPLRAASVNFAYCIGVVQHTPDRNAAITQVVRTVAPGGAYCFTIYARQPWTKLNAKYLVRPITKRLPEHVLLSAIERSMPVLFPLTDVLFRVPVFGKVAKFAIPVANYPGDKLSGREQRYREAVLDTFDMLAPAFDEPMTAGEVEAALRRADVRSIHFHRRVPVTVRGDR